MRGAILVCLLLAPIGQAQVSDLDYVKALGVDPSSDPSFCIEPGDIEVGTHCDGLRLPETRRPVEVEPAWGVKEAPPVASI